MFSRLPSLLLACTALIGSLLVMASPAQAAVSVTHSTSVVAMSSAGTGRIYATCVAKTRCRGEIWVSRSERLGYSIEARSAAWVTFKFSAWQTMPVAKLQMSGAAARTITMEAPVSRGHITGTITRAGGPTVTEIKAELWRLGSRNRNEKVNVIDVPSSGAFSFSVPMGVNNGPSAAYKIHFIGTENGSRRSWWWRGGNGSFTGGAREMALGSPLGVNRAGGYNFTSNATYSAISGHVTSGATPVAGTEVTLIARPPFWSGSAKVLRDYDIMSCAYIFGRAKTNTAGFYQVGFVPTSNASIYAVKSTGSLWNNRYGTCHGVVNYRKEASSTPSMLALAGAGTTQDLNTAIARTNVNVSVGGYQGPSSTSNVDRFLTVREYAPGRTLLSSDVVKATAGRQVQLGEGFYWVEVGRRTGCSAWYKSRYKDNDGYFNGLDRGFEKWKAKNYRMYRQHCRAYTTGAYKLVYVSGATTNVALKNAAGGSVSGKVSAAKIKPRTELMVRLTSTDGRKVYRTALTDGSGRFKVTGLESGRYQIVVNADSWRGISRSFKGAKTVTVRRGHNKSVGTLRFSQGGKQKTDKDD